MEWRLIRGTGEVGSLSYWYRLAATLVYLTPSGFSYINKFLLYLWIVAYILLSSLLNVLQVDSIVPSPP